MHIHHAADNETSIEMLQFTYLVASREPVFGLEVLLPDNLVKQQMIKSMSHRGL
jgi:hypothetical protein